MTTTQTIHPTDDSTVRRVTLDDGTTEDFDVDDSGDVPSHEYAGDGTPPQEAVDALETFLKEYHDAAPPEALPDVETTDEEPAPDAEMFQGEDGVDSAESAEQP